MRSNIICIGLVFLFGTNASIAGKTYKYCVTCPEQGILMCEFDSGPVDVGKKAGQVYCAVNIGRQFHTSCSSEDYSDAKCGDKKSLKVYAERYDKDDLLDIVSGDPKRMAMAVAKTPVAITETTVKVIKKPSIIVDPVIEFFKKIF